MTGAGTTLETTRTQPGKRALARKFAYALVGAGLGLLLLAPWAVYELGLSNITTLPAPPDSRNVTPATAKAIWAQLKEAGPVTVTPLSPYSYVLALTTNENALPPGARLAWFVARHYNAGNLKDSRTLWWHVSGMALTIWLTRNWSTGELIAKANEIDPRGLH